MKNETQYTLIPNSIFENAAWAGLSGSETKVYIALCKFYNFKERMAWPSLSTIAKATGLNSKHVGRAVNSLCLTGLIFKVKNTSTNNGFDRNSYFLPDYISYQIEKLEPNYSANKQEIEGLRKLETYLLKEIQKTRPTTKMVVATTKNRVGTTKKSKGTTKTTDNLPPQSPSNNTTINTTINITKNVKDNEEESTGFNHKRSLSVRGSTQHIGEIGPLIRIKQEGLVQEIAAALNDHKSIPFFRKVVSKFADHEDHIYKCLSLTRETDEISGINTSRGAVFTDHIKREAVQLGIEL
jgi:hypothetical protein